MEPKPQPNETARLQHEAQQAIDFFTKLGYHVEIHEQNDPNLVPAEDEIICGDGRYGNLPDGTAGKNGRAIFGSLWGYMALKTRGTFEGLRSAVGLLKEKGIKPTYHDDEHHGENPLPKCGMFGVWQSGKLSTGVLPYELGEDSGAILNELESQDVSKTTLPGGHTENQVHISFVRGSVAGAAPERFRLDGTLVHDLGIALQNWLGMSEQVFQLLKNGKAQEALTLHVYR